MCAEELETFAKQPTHTCIHSERARAADPPEPNHVERLQSSASSAARQGRRALAGGNKVKITITC